MSDDPYDRHRYHNADTFRIQSTAGAVPIKNQKGEVSMQKVKVQRYISGKKPSYGHGNRRDSDYSEEEDDFTYAAGKSYRRDDIRIDVKEEPEYGGEEGEGDEDRPDDDDDGEEAEVEAEVAVADLDPRLRRLAASRGRDKQESEEEEEEADDEVHRRRRHRQQRQVHAPEVLSDDGGDEKPPKSPEAATSKGDMELASSDSSSSDDDLDDDDDDDLDDEGIQRRRDLMRQRALAKAQIGLGQEELLAKEDEKPASESEEETSSEEETDSSDEEEGARLKPVFVRKKDRLTVQEREREEAKQRQQEHEAQRAAEARRRETLRMVESTVKAEVAERKNRDNDPLGLNEVNTDDENEEGEYESWKLRELKRMKRDREEREARERELQEIERMRNMTEEERRHEIKNNPRQITNKSAKGKYKFMQKYYHRGAFFLDKEEGILKRDNSAATLEDKFDKTVLPKVMQVKNFGRSGRTKYTHLVDQDTTQFDAAWSQETAQNLKFQLNHSGGMKPVFERPSAKKKNK